MPHSLLRAILLSSILTPWPGGSPAAEEGPLPRTRAQLASGQPTRVVCLGDSVTGIYYHTGGRRAYSDMLHIGLRRLFPTADVTVINAGVSGNTTQNGLDRLERDVLRHQPILVTVMFGLNDMTRVPLETFRDNLGQIIDRCRTAGTEVLLATPNQVIDTPARPITKLETYCEAIREVGRDKQVPVADCYRAGESDRRQDPRSWRLQMSDEIHPNMDGHQRLAEVLVSTIAGRTVSLSDIPPPADPLRRTRAQLTSGGTLRVLSMTPCDQWLAAVLAEHHPGARPEITAWPTDNRSLAELEQEAQRRVRGMKPDLVVLAVPRASDRWEDFVRHYAWIMNWALSFGRQEWDCLVVHPSVLSRGTAANEHDDLIRTLVAAQDLTLIDRQADDARPGREVFRDAVGKLLTVPAPSVNR